MLHEKLLNRHLSTKIIEAYKNHMPLLHELAYAVGGTSNSTFYEIRRAIHVIRDKYKKIGIDRLHVNLELWGNNGGRMKAWNAKKMEKLYNDKKPPSDGRYVSVEIECIFPDNRAVNQFAKAMFDAKLSDSITIKDDGSLRCDGNMDCGSCNGDQDECEECGGRDNSVEQPKEIVVTFPEGKFEALKVVCDKLQALYVTVNTSCGLHVHFDLRQFKTRSRLNLMSERIGKVVPALRFMLPKSRARNQYCALDVSIGSDRYAFVNKCAYTRHKTIEIRGHSGTINFVKISNWIKIMQTIAKCKALDAIEVKVLSIDTLLQIVTFPTELAEYIKARNAHFYPDNNRNVEEYMSEAA